MSAPSAPPALPGFAEAFGVWLRIGLLSFGGPAGQIALMHRILVEEKRWIGERRFLHALNYCMVLPGPEATQLACYVGWLLHGVAGGMVAGWLFVLPGAAVMMALSAIYALWGAVPFVAALFFGLKCAVLMLVLEATLRIGRRALKGAPMWALAAGAFVAIFFLGVPFPLIVLGAGLVGWAGASAGWRGFGAGAGHGAATDGAHPAALDALLDRAEQDAAGRAMLAARALAAQRAGLVTLLLWLAPVGALFLALGASDTFTRIGAFFSVMAVVTFGGAYAVLAYVAQAAVESYGWLAAGEMLDGLGLAETTPGPLILVTQFVGFLAAYRDPGALAPLLAGILGAALTVWVTFAPCFVWIFLGAPAVEKLRANKALAGALGAITAAVVGVILNLAVWFALHVLFARHVAVSLGPVHFDAPVPASADAAAMALAAIAGAALFRFRLGVVPTLGIAAVAGLAWRLAAGTP
ncbi:MAG: chromate efflux transporter [Alphaproteobacteria bacterium]|nr:chromate efflux transporter [Alphaproteobacteria bacterium]